jgi:hypothetical protein
MEINFQGTIPVELAISEPTACCSLSPFLDLFLPFWQYERLEGFSYMEMS